MGWYCDNKVFLMRLLLFSSCTFQNNEIQRVLFNTWVFKYLKHSSVLTTEEKSQGSTCTR